MNKNIQINKDGSVEVTELQAEIHIIGLKPTTDDGHTARLESPYYAKDDIKALDYEATGRSWDGQNWTFKFDALPEVLEHFESEGYDVTVPMRLLKRYESEYGERFWEDS